MLFKFMEKDKGDLMVDLSQIKKQSTLQMIEGTLLPQKHRPYLGMSQIGHECERYLWYCFRWAFLEEITPRLNRLFERGHREEPEIVKALATVGIKCFDDQEEVVAGFGHIKAIVTENLLELLKRQQLSI